MFKLIAAWALLTLAGLIIFGLILWLAPQECHHEFDERDPW